MFSAIKRLQKEAASISNTTLESDGLQLTPNEDLMKWKAKIVGPSETIYHNYIFDLDIILPSEYPMKPPIMKFITPIFHPNIHFESGEICLDILKTTWSPAWSLQTACRAIIALLAAPDPTSPLNCDAGNMLRADDTAAFESVAHMYCIENCKKFEIKEKNS